MSNPKVTVLMPVYNGEKYLREAIESILNQTFTDFEFLIINDGSTDNSVNIINSYHDPRIKLVENERNLRLIATLNKGLEISQGEYIARMDCDDVSLPERLEKQVAFMDQNSNIGICGTWIQCIGEGKGTYSYPVDPAEIKANLFFDSVLAHPSVIMRSCFLKQYGLCYNYEFLHAEDLGLWQESSLLFDIANIPEVLLYYRKLSGSVSNANRDKQSEILRKMARKNLQGIGIMIDDEVLLESISRFDFPKTKEVLLKIESLLKKIIEQNSISHKYPEAEFVNAAGKRWFLICYHSGKMGMMTWNLFFGSTLSMAAKLTWKEKMKFFIKCAFRWSTK